MFWAAKILFSFLCLPMPVEKVFLMICTLQNEVGRWLIELMIKKPGSCLSWIPTARICSAAALLGQLQMPQFGQVMCLSLRSGLYS